MIVRLAHPSDSATLAALDAQCNPSPWSEKQFAACIGHANETVLLAEQGKELAGLIVWQTVLNEAELHLIDTAPARRRQGVASLLLAHMLKQSAAKNIRRIFLEVRSSNRAAFALYQQHGFIPSGSRPGYYPRPDGSREDALPMEKLC